MRKTATMIVRGRTSEWAISFDASQDQIEAMRADGIDVGILMHRVPAWAVELGLLRPWCFAQDVWNFRNPFRSPQ